MNKHKKKSMAIILALVLASSIYTLAADAPSMSNFARVDKYSSGQFPDMDESQWYGFNNQKSVARAFEYGLMRGNADGTFNPTGSFTLAEAIAVAARVHRIYATGGSKFVQGDTWYQVYVDYAVANGIIKANDFSNYTQAATRAEMAYIFTRSLADTEFAELNTVSSLPDVNSETQYADAIITLFKAGVVTGNDTSGTFFPGNNIIRAEAAAIISRVILPETRESGRTYGFGLSGIWRYVRSAEGGEPNEIVLSPDQNEFWNDIEASSHFIDIRGDYTIRIKLGEHEIETVMIKIDAYTYEIPRLDTDYYPDTNNVLTYNPETGLLRYTWVFADIHHYFTRDPG